jgi:hypothetical protein
MNPIEQLKSVLCDPSGKCCIAGSDEDRAIVDRALQALAEQPAQQEYERGVIDGMQEQMKRSVDRAVNAMAQRTWVGLTDEEIWDFWWSRPEVPEGEDDSMEAEFVAAVRRVLDAHGIKENT